MIKCSKCFEFKNIIYYREYKCNNEVKLRKDCKSREVYVSQIEKAKRSRNCRCITYIKR